MWFWFALGSAVFAALVSILAKIGIEGVDSNLATAVRTIVVVIMAWGMVFLTHQQSGLSEISQKSWIFLILSVVITILLTFLFLHEQFTVKSLLGCVLIGAGTLLMVL